MVRFRARQRDAGCDPDGEGGRRGGTDSLGEGRRKRLFVGVKFDDTENRSGKEIVTDTQKHCYERGVIVWTAGRRGNVLRLLPPLVRTEEQAAIGLDVIAEAIAEHAP